jgi:hypothetical protein
VAPVAKQQGQYVAEVLKAALQGRSSPPFRYRDLGSLATIGRKSAVAELGRLKLSGFAAWLLWSLAHIYFLIGFRNRFAVALNWAWNYATFQRGSRLITGISGSRIEDMARENPAPDSADEAAQFLTGAESATEPVVTTFGATALGASRCNGLSGVSSSRKSASTP